MARMISRWQSVRYGIEDCCLFVVNCFLRSFIVALQLLGLAGVALARSCEAVLDAFADLDEARPIRRAVRRLFPVSFASPADHHGCEPSDESTDESQLQPSNGQQSY